MAYDGTLKFDTSLDASGVQKGANKLGDIVKGLGIFEILKKGVQMIADSVGAAMNRIDTMEQFNRVMTTMTNSAEQANSALERTTAIVTGTAYGLDTAAKGVQAFVSAGMGVQNATDTMEAWADATSFYTKGTNAELESVSAALQKMQTKGTVTMEHLQMLLEAGIPAVQIYASAVGASTEDVTDAMSKGELKTDDFISVMNTAFETGTSGFPAIAGAAKTAGASWQGSMDNMRAAISRGTAAVLEQLDATLNVRTNMVAFGKTFEQVLKSVAANLDVIIPLAVGAVAAFAAFKVVKSIPPMIEAAKVAMQAFGATLTTTTGVVGLILAALAAAIGIVDALSNRVTGLTDDIKASTEAANEQHTANQSLIDSLKQVDAEHEKAITAATLDADANRVLTERLYELQGVIQSGAASSGELAAAQREMAEISSKLNTNVAGLGLEIDSATGSINMNRDALLKAISAQEEYNKAVSDFNYAKEKMNALRDIEVELYVTEKRLSEQKQETIDLYGGEADALGAVNNTMGHTMPEMWAMMKATKAAAESTEELAGDQEYLKNELTYTEEIYKEMMAASLELMQHENDMGQTIQEVAELYGVTADEIRASAEYSNEGLQAWCDAQDARLEEQQAQLEEWQEAVKENTNAVVNSFEELPTKMDVSMQGMIDVMNQNAATIAEWDGLLKAAEGILSPEVIAMLQEQGTASIEILKSAIADPEKAAELNAAYSGVLDGAIKKANEIVPASGQVGESMSSETAAGMENQKSTVENEAATVMADSLTAMSSTVFENTSRVVSSIQSLCTQLIVGLKQLQPRSAAVIVNVMTTMADTMDRKAGALYAKATEVANGVIRRMNKAFDIHSPSRAARYILSMFLKGGVLGLADEENNIFKKIDEITGGVLSRFGQISEADAFSMSGQMRYAIAGNHAAMTNGQMMMSGGVQVLERTKTNTISPNIVVNNNVDAELIVRKIKRAAVTELGV